MPGSPAEMPKKRALCPKQCAESVCVRLSVCAHLYRTHAPVAGLMAVYPCLSVCPYASICPCTFGCPYVHTPTPLCQVPVCLSTYLYLSVRLSTYLSVFMPVYPCLSVCLSMYLHLFMSVYLYVRPCTYIHLSVHVPMSIHVPLSVCPSRTYVHPSAYLYVCPSICPCVHLSIHVPISVCLSPHTHAIYRVAGTVYLPYLSVCPRTSVCLYPHVPISVCLSTTLSVCPCSYIHQSIYPYICPPIPDAVYIWRQAGYICHSYTCPHTPVRLSMYPCPSVRPCPYTHVPIPMSLYPFPRRCPFNAPPHLARRGRTTSGRTGGAKLPRGRPLRRLPLAARRGRGGAPPAAESRWCGPGCARRRGRAGRGQSGESR